MRAETRRKFYLNAPVPNTVKRAFVSHPTPVFTGLRRAGPKMKLAAAPLVRAVRLTVPAPAHSVAMPILERRSAFRKSCPPVLLLLKSLIPAT
ncbi:hypothetical protein SBV1_220019 [Verrucomicrobia bacterium]|nr:hypothetical protein SBV1_220019 [Verrucomicrobiota bacterium]